MTSQILNSKELRNLAIPPPTEVNTLILVAEAGIGGNGGDPPRDGNGNGG